MRIDPEIAALRDDPSRQRRSRAAMESAHTEWLKAPDVVAARAELARYSRGEALGELSCLGRLLSDRTAAIRFSASLQSALLRILAGEPLGEIPLRHTSSEGFARLQLLSSGRATLSLCVYEPRRSMRRAQSVQFSDCESNELVLAGEARVVMHRLNAASGIASVEKRWRTGSRASRRGLIEARQVLKVRRSLLVLQLARTPERPSPSREYRLGDGALLREASGDRRASGQIMALAVLGALGRCCDVPALIEFASCRANDANARWEAVRQLLGSDGQTGLRLLKSLSEVESEPLAHPAGELLVRLAERAEAFA